MYLRNKYCYCFHLLFGHQACLKAADKNTCGANDRGPWQKLQTQHTHHAAARACTPAGSLLHVGVCMSLCQTAWLCSRQFECVFVRHNVSVRSCKYASMWEGSRLYQLQTAIVLIIPNLNPWAAVFTCSPFAFPPPELCLKARQCACTPWLTSEWSSMARSPTRKAPTTSGWRTLGKFPTLDLALWV